jgi:Ca2+-binding EF-hand superfamily protein
MRLSLIVASMALTAAVLPGTAAEQNRAAARMRFAEMDADKDGVITRKEWRGSDVSFTVHDWNKDGVLSRGEVRVGARRPARNTSPADFAQPDRTYWFTDWTLVAFHRLDHNSDGSISRDEWHFDPEGFRRVDHDRNGTLSRSEFLDTDTGEDDDRDDSFANLDVDADGRLTRTEWHGTPARFDALDQDQSGVLTREEVAGPEEPVPDLFASVDVNRNGSIEWSEWHWSRASFDARDPNRDGRITRDEINLSDTTIVAQAQAHRDGYERGLADGRLAGQRDRDRGVDWNLEGRQELVAADAGYAEGPNTRIAYQTGYRDGFRRGYREGYSPD